MRADPAAFLAAVDRGEPVTLVRDTRPVAEVTPLLRPSQPQQQRPIGLYKGQFVLPDDFDEPSPDWVFSRGAAADGSQGREPLE